MINTLDVTENVFLNREPLTRIGLFDKKKTSVRTVQLLDSIGIRLDVTSKIRDLSVIEQQTVEIVKALSIDADIIIMDETSAALSDKELSKLFEIIHKLRNDGKTIIYIYHMLEEVFSIADRVTVLKDGKVMATENTCFIDRNRLVSLMVGREIDDVYPDLPEETGETVLSVEALSGDGIENITLTLKKGEILGVAGIAGSGRSALVETILGLHQGISGNMELNGISVKFRNIREAISSGFCYIHSDHKNKGIIAPESITVNTTITNLDKYKSRFLLKKNAEEKVTRE